ncbi:MAG: hypothetical protein SOU82_03815 [Alloprevotella sp.]|nr:hypothetical protein [Alloprevotella sp.]MDY4059293.1 hypothetical protein [Alloprevotella sp.]
MTRLGRSLSAFIVALLTTFTVTACDDHTAVSTFRSFPETGWERTDTVVVQLDSLAAAGRYVGTVHVRLSTAHPYPFQELLIAVERDLMLAGDSLQALRDTTIDTLKIVTASDRGDYVGRGISVLEYAAEPFTVDLPAGTSGRFCVRHLMTRTPLEGIREVGLTLRRD